MRPSKNGLRLLWDPMKRSLSNYWIPFWRFETTNHHQPQLPLDPWFAQSSGNPYWLVKRKKLSRSLDFRGISRSLGISLDYTWHNRSLYHEATDAFWFDSYPIFGSALAFLGHSFVSTCRHGEDDGNQPKSHGGEVDFIHWITRKAQRCARHCENVQETWVCWVCWNKVISYFSPPVNH